VLADASSNAEPIDSQCSLVTRFQMAFWVGLWDLSLVLVHWKKSSGDEFASQRGSPGSPCG
jgi:hypothetical protein